MIFKAPENISKRDFHFKSVFLAGSIEMGKAIDWQTEMSDFFHKKNWNIFNPRRDDWDSSWEQNYLNPQFSQQVNWELHALDVADLIIMYFDPSTKSPISLLELGLYANSGKLRVVCPDDFWRKGNVEIVCNKYDIPFYDTLEVLKLDLAEY
jgi:hypothetical protein